MIRFILYKFSGILSILLLLGSCSTDSNHPGYEYMPDMSRSIAYKAFEANLNFPDSSNELLPVAGTIPRGHLPYSYTKDSAGYASAALLNNKVNVSESNLAEGQRLYEIYCSPCHGKTGAGDGLVVTKGGFAIPPKYTDANAAMTKHNVKEMTGGQIYHTIMVGSSIMGSYASQLSENERWQIVHYVELLQGKEKILIQKDWKKIEDKLTTSQVTGFNFYFIPLEGGDGKLIHSENGKFSNEMINYIKNAKSGEKVLLDEIVANEGKEKLAGQFFEI